MYSIAVEIEHKKYAQLIRSDGPSTGRLDLTTLVDYQKRALVRIFLFRGDKPKVLIREIVLDELPQKHAGDIRIVLTGELRGGKRLALTLRYGGQTVHSSVVSLRSHLRSSAVWFLVPAAVVAAGAILFFALYTRGTPSDPAEPGGTSGQAAAGETPKEPVQTRERPDTAGPERPGEDPEGTEREDALTDAAEAEETVESGEETAEGEAAEEEPERQPAAAPVTETVTVYFEPNRSRLVDEARETLNTLSRLLEEFEEISVRIEGHCALKGSEQGRIELSDERSEAVRRYLLGTGWTPDGALEVEGYGGNQPVTLTEEDQYLNRRVEVTVTYYP